MQLQPPNQGGHHVRWLTTPAATRHRGFILFIYERFLGLLKRHIKNYFDRAGERGAFNDHRVYFSFKSYKRDLVAVDDEIGFKPVDLRRLKVSIGGALLNERVTGIYKMPFGPEFYKFVLNRLKIVFVEN